LAPKEYHGLLAFLYIAVFAIGLLVITVVNRFL
jgi:hypothetical protein